MPADVTSSAEVQLSSGVPFVSDADLEAALADAGVSGPTAAAIVDENATARLNAAGRASVLAVLAWSRWCSVGASRPPSPLVEVAAAADDDAGAEPYPTTPERTGRHPGV